MSTIGTSLHDFSKRIMRLLGIVFGGVVRLPGAEDLHKSVANKAPLESHHSNFVIIPRKEWRGETSSINVYNVASTKLETSKYRDLSQ